MTGDHCSAKIDAVSLNIPTLDFGSVGREGVRQGVNKTAKVVNGWIGLELEESGTKGLQAVVSICSGAEEGATKQKCVTFLKPIVQH